MKTTKLIRGTLFAAVLAVFALGGCENLELYSIDAPDDLQSRIDSIAAVKASQSTGDTTYLDIATALVGAEDNSAAWWTAFSDYFVIPSNKLLSLTFINHGTGVNNWENWNLAVVNEVADRDADGYAEYFVLRSDAYGWEGKMVDQGYTFDLALLAHNYAEVSDNEDFWVDFRATMEGATVTLEIDHSASGNVFLTATAVGTNGTELVMTYQQPVSATENIVAFLVADHSHFEMKEAYLIPSKVAVVEDQEAASITVTGAPEFVELGNEDFWQDAVATVTFADGSSAEVDTADVTFAVIPEMSTLGEKTVLVAYSKTKQGKFGRAVSTYYTFEVTNPVASLEITSMPELTEYYFFGEDSILFSPKGLVVTATYLDGTTGVLANSSLKFSKIPAVAGTQNAVISFEGAVSTVTVDCPITMTEGIARVGAVDFSTAWWGAHSEDFAVAAGESKTLTMYCYSEGLENWHSPVTILRASDLAEYAVVRMDNSGWGDGYASATATNDWDFDNLAPNIFGSRIVITVTNNGDNTADVNYDVTYANGETHFQNYEGITVDSSDLNCALTIELAYLVLVDVE